jgi:hypothetical protein
LVGIDQIAYSAQEAVAASVGQTSGIPLMVEDLNNIFEQVSEDE